MNAQAITLVGGLALSQLARRINMDTPERVWALRVLYLSVHALIFAMYLYIARKVSGPCGSVCTSRDGQ